MTKLVDKSWGVPGTASVRVRSNDTVARETGRSEARLGRAADRVEAMARRQDARAARREADDQAREQARTQRREREQQAASGDPHAAAAQRRRSSGRRDVVREQRDTSGYTMIVDVERMRALAKRGATVSGLSAVFGVPEDEVERLLDGSA